MIFLLKVSFRNDSYLFRFFHFFLLLIRICNFSQSISAGIRDEQEDDDALDKTYYDSVCGTLWQEKYMAFHKRSLQSVSENNAKNVKYLIYLPIKAGAPAAF